MPRRRPSVPKAPLSPPRAARPRRRPVFALSAAQVFATVAARNRRPICAGEVIALMRLMEWRGWTIMELSSRAKVSESHISEVLRVQKFLTSDCADRLAASFGLKLHEFDKLAQDIVDRKVSP